MHISNRTNVNLYVLTAGNSSIIITITWMSNIFNIEHYGSSLVASVNIFSYVCLKSSQNYSDINLLFCFVLGFMLNVVTGDHYKFVSWSIGRSSYFISLLLMFLFVRNLSFGIYLWCSLSGITSVDTKYG